MRKLVTLSGVSAGILFCVLSASRANAAGYLTSMLQGIPVTQYMANNYNAVGGFTIFVSGISNPDGCTGTDKVYINGDAAGFKQVVAAVMTAVASGKKLGFYSTGCAVMPFWGGTITYPVIRDVWVVN